MKSKLLLLTASALLLIGCGSNTTPTDSSSTQSESTSITSESSIEEPSEELESSSEEISEESLEESSEEELSESSEEESSVEESSEQLPEEKVFKAQFRISGKMGQKTGDSDKNFKDVLEPYFLDGEDQLLKDVDTPEGYFAQVNYFADQGEDESVKEYSTLSLGSAKKYGYLTLDFNYPITKINVEAQGYFKYYAYTGYSGWSVDSDCQLGVNEFIALELPTEVDTRPEVISQEYEFEEEITSLTLFTAGEGRLFIHSLEITYLVD